MYNFSYQIPTINRVVISAQLFQDRLDSADVINVRSSVKRSVRWRPQASAIKPQKCDATITPIKLTELMKPCSAIDISRSHLAVGSTYDMDSFSKTVAIAATPDTTTIMY